MSNQEKLADFKRIVARFQKAVKASIRNGNLFPVVSVSHQLENFLRDNDVSLPKLSTKSLAAIDGEVVRAMKIGKVSRAAIIRFIQAHFALEEAIALTPEEAGNILDAWDIYNAVCSADLEF